VLVLHHLFAQYKPHNTSSKSPVSIFMFLKTKEVRLRSRATETSCTVVVVEMDATAKRAADLTHRLTADEAGGAAVFAISSTAVL
jgi:hypothetical protein